ncbi:MAG: oligosaccharide flippase family protein [Gaiellaceae bacterium]
MGSPSTKFRTRPGRNVTDAAATRGNLADVTNRPLTSRPVVTTAVRPSPGVDAVPPVTPNNPRRPPIPGAERVGRNTIETLLFRGISTPVAFALVVIQSRFLDPEGRGRFVLVVLTVSILARLLGQLGVAVTSLAGEGELRPLAARALTWTVLLGVGGAGLILLAGVTINAFGLRLAAIAAPALVPNILNACLSGILLGRARIRLWNVIQVLPPLLTLAGMLLVVVGLGGGVDAAVGVWTIAYVLTAVVALIAARDLWLPLTRVRILDRLGRAIARLALAMGFVQIVNLIGYRVELFVLEHFKGLGQVGIYSIAMQAAEAIWLIPAAVASAVTGPVVHEDEEGAARQIRSACGKGLLYTTAVAVAIGVTAPFVIPLVFGDAFRGAVRPLVLLLPGVVAYAPVTILVVYLTVRRAQPRLSLYVSLIGLVVTAGMSVVLIPPYGASGAAVASAIGYAAGGVAAWLFFVTLARRDGETALSPSLTTARD